MHVIIWDYYRVASPSRKAPTTHDKWSRLKITHRLQNMSLMIVILIKTPTHDKVEIHKI